MALVGTHHSHDVRRAKGPSFWSRLINRYLTKKFSLRFKRMIFISSVLGLLENIQTPDKEMMSKLNDILKLAHNNDAIAFPMYIHSFLWRNCDTETCLPIDGRQVPLTELSGSNMTVANYHALARYLINSAPRWMIYGSEQTIAKDLELLFKSVPQLLH